MHRWFAAKEVHGVPTELHIITVSRNTLSPVEYNASYRSITAFRTRELDRMVAAFRLHTNEPLLYNITLPSQVMTEFKLSRMVRFSTSSWDGLPIIRHQGVWDFYNHIGWDHKRKKFI